MSKKVKLILEDICSISKVRKTNGKSVIEDIGDFSLMIEEKEKVEEAIYIARPKTKNVINLLGGDINVGNLVFTQEDRYVIDSIDYAAGLFIMKKFKNV